MIPVSEARERIVSSLQPVGMETIPAGSSLSRIVAKNIIANITHPPLNVSAMDGFAVRGKDLSSLPTDLKYTGEIPAGSVHDKEICAGETVAVFTGSSLPPGTDTVVIQENTEHLGDKIRFSENTALGKNVRLKGSDFYKGDTIFSEGDQLSSRDVALAIASGVSEVCVRKAPKIAILCSGNELVVPGVKPGNGQIISSNGATISSLVTCSGGVAIDLGIISDDKQHIKNSVSELNDIDLLVTVGGASVGKHDLVQSALTELGFNLNFWKVALRPGKPAFFGNLSSLPILGFPGNPVSAFICAILFLRPAIKTLLGSKNIIDTPLKAKLGRDLHANDHREEYLRSKLEIDSGEMITTPFSVQDSGQLSLLSEAQCLTIREANAPNAIKGDLVNILPFNLSLSGL